MRSPQSSAALLASGLLVSLAASGCGPGRGSDAEALQDDPAAVATAVASDQPSARLTDAPPAGTVPMRPTATPAAAPTIAFAPFRDRWAPITAPGFATFVREGRLWVFRQGSEGLDEFLASGEPAKSATMVGAGPGGITMRSEDRGTVVEYLASTPGYVTEYDDGVLWVFAEGSEGLVQYRSFGEPARNVTVVGAGPGRTSLRSDDRDVITAFLAWKPGFVTIGDEGRLWVFAAGSDDLAEYRRSGEPARSVTVLRAGPRGETVKSGDADTINAWLAARPGYVTIGDEDRVWVFKEGSAGLGEYRRMGEPAKSITMIGAGPRGRTLRSEDKATLMTYLGHVPGFDVFADAEENRLYVFETGSDGARDFVRFGEPAKSITRVAAGPRRMTVVSDDAATLNRYLRALGS